MVKVITFGCRLNLYESDIIKNFLAQTKSDNITVINSCAVTNEAERQVKQSIRRVYRENSEQEIIVVGCAAELNPEIYKKMPGVVKVLGNKEKLQYRNYLNCNHKLEKIRKEKSEVIFLSFQNRSRPFVQIQNGCNHSCTFCCITHARGENKSVPITSIVEQVRLLVRNGHKEIVLTGVNITGFGVDLPGNPSLGSMIRRLLNLVPELKRLRLSSIDVAEIDNELFNIIVNEPRLMPHIHISAQSGDNMILKRMKRRHNREKIIEFCAQVRKNRPEVVFGADMIAGFPTESEEMFKNSYDVIIEAGITYLHVFPYSNKNGTPASRMPQVAVNVRKERAKRLRKLGENQLKSFYRSQIGSTHEIIIEKENFGRAQNFALVKFEGSYDVGNTIKVKIINSKEDKYLVGVEDNAHL